MRLNHICKSAVLTLLLITGNAFAAYTAYLYESGGNVVASGSGSFNLAGATPTGPAASTPLVGATQALLYTGPGPNLDLYSGTAGPVTFGVGVITSASSSTGDFVGIVGSPSRFFVRQGYVSGSALASSATWNGQTLASLGLTPGTYTWTWGAGANADSYTLYIGTAPPVQSIPALADSGLIILAMLLIALAYAKRGAFRKG